MKAEVLRTFQIAPQEIKNVQAQTKRFLVEFASSQDSVGVVCRFDKEGFLAQILPEAVAMKGIVQRPDSHLKGVWEHTMEVLRYLSSKDASLDLRLAALFHHIGQIETAAVGPDDTVDRPRTGAEITGRIVDRFHTFCPQVKINKDKIVWLVRYHLVGQGSGDEILREATIRKYFLRPDGWGNDLLTLIKADSVGRIRTTPRYKMLLLEKTIARIKDTEGGASGTS